MKAILWSDLTEPGDTEIDYSAVIADWASNYVSAAIPIAYRQAVLWTQKK